MSPTVTLRGSHKIFQVSRCHGPYSKMFHMRVTLRSQNVSSLPRNFTGTWIFVTFFRAACQRLLIRFHLRLILPVNTASFPNSNLQTDGIWRRKQISRMARVFLFVWYSWISASWYNYENKQQDAIYRLIYYSNLALHVSGDIFVHHQEHLTVFTVSGSVHPSCCRLVAC